MVTDGNGDTVCTTESGSDTDIALSFTMWLLLIGGVLLVMLSYQIGQVCVQHCVPNGNCEWSTDDVDRAATVVRSLGGMMFAAGLVERLIKALTKART